MDGYLPTISLRAIRGYDLRPVPEDVLTRIPPEPDWFQTVSVVTNSSP
jgi:hypothetical protein